MRTDASWKIPEPNMSSLNSLIKTQKGFRLDDIMRKKAANRYTGKAGPFKYVSFLWFWMYYDQTIKRQIILALISTHCVIVLQNSVQIYQQRFLMPRVHVLISLNVSLKPLFLCFHTSSQQKKMFLKKNEFPPHCTALHARDKRQSLCDHFKLTHFQNRPYYCCVWANKCIFEACPNQSEKSVSVNVRKQFKYFPASFIVVSLSPSSLPSPGLPHQRWRPFNCLARKDDMGACSERAATCTTANLSPY